MIHSIIALSFSLFVNAADEPKSRSFQFTYETTITGLAAGEKASIWLPVPPDLEEQRIEIAAIDLPGRTKLGREAKYGNRILFVEAMSGKDGTIPLKIVYQITRRELRGESRKPSREEETLFLKPDAKVPAEGKYLKLIEGKKLPDDALDLSRTLYDIVNAELVYSKKGTGWGQGDVNWVCDSKYGNCTDFHSLFIGLARKHDIPGKFEIGFPLPVKRGSGEIPGYHCWAKFRPAGKGWIPVDISMANQDPTLRDYCFGNLTEDRVTFSIGRDIDLVPKQSGPPLNFFVYPYVEVAGKPWPAEKINRRFAYEDGAQH